MQTMRTFGAALLATACTLSSAQSANCVSSTYTTPLKVAAIQQELMVAALTCHDIARYNRFVRSRQRELIKSDNRLKAYFVHRTGGEAAYHTFKTELANDSSLRSSREADSFCGHADSIFDVADGSTSLSALVSTQSFALGAEFQDCPGRGENASVTDDSGRASASASRHRKKHSA
jgi:hypothetical protein